MVACDAGLVQPAQLRAREQAVRGAEVDRKRPLHLLVRLDGLVEIALRERPSRGHDGEAVRAGFLVGTRVADDFLLRQEAVLVDARMVAGRLRAVFAVLAAASRAAVDNGAKVDMLAAEMSLQPAGAFLQFLQGSGEEDGEIV